MRKMIDLAQRFACHFGGGGEGGTEANIPDELKPLYKKTANRMLRMQSQNPLTRFAKENVKDVAGTNDLSNLAQGELSELYGNEPFMGAVGGSQSQMSSRADSMWKQNPWDHQASNIASDQAYQNSGDAVRAAGTAVTGNMIANDPALQNQQKVFEQTTMPMIANQMGSMGLGRSGAAGQAASNAWAQQATPLMQEAANRQERGIDRRVDAYQNAASTNLGRGQLYNQQYNSKINQMNSAMDAENKAAQLGLAAGDQWQNRRLDILDRGQAWGEQNRMNEQAGYDAAQDDYLRRQGLAENALYVPFGQMANTIGQRNTGGGK